MIIQNAASGTIAAAVRYPSFRRLLSALAVSQIGDWLYNLSLIALVYHRTHSPLWTGVTTAARIVPLVVLGPLGGVIVDRFDRRRVMIISDLARLGLMVLLALVAVADLPVVLAPVIAALATAAGTPYLPAVSATTPRLVADADLPGANAARSAVAAIGIVAGPALSGVLLLLGSPAVAFLVNAATFGVSAFAVLAIPAGRAFRPARSGAHGGGLLRGVAEGAAVLRGHPEALRLVGADITHSLIYGAQTVLLMLVADRIGLGAKGYGYMFAGIGVGGLIGTALASRALRCPHPRYVLMAALGAIGLPMPLLAVVHWPVAAIALASVTGAGGALAEILAETGLQRTLDEEFFGRAYGLALPASVGGIVLGSILAPVLVSTLGTSGALVAVGVAALAYGLFLLPGRDRNLAGLAVPSAPVAQVSQVG